MTIKLNDLHECYQKQQSVFTLHMYFSQAQSIAEESTYQMELSKTPVDLFALKKVEELNKMPVTTSATPTGNTKPRDNL